MAQLLLRHTHLQSQLWHFTSRLVHVLHYWHVPVSLKNVWSGNRRPLSVKVYGTVQCKSLYSDLQLSYINLPAFCSLFSTTRTLYKTQYTWTLECCLIAEHILNDQDRLQARQTHSGISLYILHTMSQLITPIQIKCCGMKFWLIPEVV